MAERIDHLVAARVRASVRKLGNVGAVENARRSAEAERHALEELDELDLRVPPPTLG